jgi:eukaryotic-like serine/threonine-protein kinase
MTASAVPMIGSTLLHYRIIRPLGRGGMGEVYAAEDTKLNRTVALKVLPQMTAADPERLSRFQREAKAIAALNHPNIVTIYSVEDADGVHFLAMELVEGKPLGALIPSGGMKPPALFDLAVPLADAVSAAHQRGIVHRDLKPSNIMVGADGRLKVLDFGLAKLTQETEATPIAETATVEQLTAHHRVIGTAAYMSPEQAEGRPVDRRSDIFSIGILLYEMATGTRPFKGESAMSILSAVIKDTPAPATEVNPKIPPDLDRVIRRCLAKDPSRRYQDALDLRNDLEDIARAGSAAQRGAFTGRRLTAWLAVTATLAIAGAAAALLWRARGDRVQPATFATLTSMPGREWFPSLSPDGKWVVFGAESEGNFDIFLQSTTSGANPVNLTKDSADDDDMPAFSPDGERIAFRSSRDGGGIFVMGRTGEAVKRVTRIGFNPSWSPDGARIAFATIRMDINPQNSEGESELWVVSATGGEPRRLFEGDAIQPSWSPHNRRVAFQKRGGAPPRRTDIWTIPVEGGEPTPLTDDQPIDWNPIWAPDGRHVYYVSDRSGTMNLWRIAVDETSGKALGEPEAIVTPAPFFAHPTISADGRLLAYSAVLRQANVQRLAFDPVTAAPAGGDPTWVTTGSRQWSDPDPSPDGQFVVYYSRIQPEGDLFVSRTDGTAQRQLTGDRALDRVPHWSPDGQWISTFSDRSGRLQIWKIRPDGSDLRQVTDGPTGSAYSTWAPDSSRLALRTDMGPGRPGRALIVDVNRPWSEQRPEELPRVPDSTQAFTPNSWSRDGQQLVGFTGPTSPSSGIVVYTLKTRTYERVTDFGEWPVWLPDSRRVLFGDGGKNFWLLDTQTKQTKVIYSGGRDVLGPPRLTADGRTMYYSRRVTEADIHLMTLR